RGAHPLAPRAVHGAHRHPQHAAGGARLRLHGLPLPRPAGRARPHADAVPEARAAPDRRLHHRPLRLEAGMPANLGRIERKAMGEHTDRQYESELRELRERLLFMAGKTEEMIALTTRSLVERDSSLAERMIDADREINRL